MTIELTDRRTLAQQAARDLEGATAHDVIAWAVETFGHRMAVASSMVNAVLADLVSRQLPGVDVLFLDTGYHFAETRGTRDAVAATMPVNVVDVRPEQSVAEQDAAHGSRLFERDPDLCCRLRKVEPLARALQGYDAWVTGVRRGESKARARTPVVTWDARHGLVKVNPLVDWSHEDLMAYADERGVLVNPLVYEGYPSIGCAPCTRPVALGADLRSGRWTGSAKTECGIHL